MYDDDEFLRSIPAFLRRSHELPPRKLASRPRDLPAVHDQPRPEPKPESKTESQPRPIPAQTAAPVAPASPKVVEITQPSADADPAAPAAQRARIALAFKNQDIPEGGSEAADSEDIAFHVTLPRSVVRQIRKLAAEKDTSQRAVLLRALRLAGLSVPDGSDIDRPAKRQA